MKGLHVNRIATPLAVCALLALLAVGAPGLASSQTSPTGPQILRARPGQVLFVGGLYMTVPPRGQSVAGDTLSTDGYERGVVVESRRDGTVAVYAGQALEALSHKGRSTESAASPATADTPLMPSACSDSAYSTYSSKWTSTLNYWIKSSSTPDEVHSDNAISALKAAAGNITGAHNDCGLSDNVGASTSYQGTTSAGTNVTSTGGCDTNDNKNVVGFGSIPSTMLALSCWWFSSGSTFAGDIRLNKASYEWVANIGSNCSNKFSIEAVSTHEFGHLFGMGHVSDSSHGNLTMSPTIAACQSSERTLGLGDVRGLESKY
jgi:hypothetical protein